MNISNWLQRQAQVHGDWPALFLGRDCVADYGQFHARAAAVAGWLDTQGLRQGDRIVLFMKNRPEFLILLYGIWMAGAVAVPVNAKLHGREAAWIVGDAGARLAFASPGLAEDLAQALEQDGAEAPVIVADPGGLADVLTHDRKAEPCPLAPQDLAWLFYTSGTTGRPKGVMITHGMLSAMCLSYLADVDHVSPEDSALYAAPLSHGAGLYALVHVLMGARHVCPASGGFDPAEILDLAAHHGRTHMFAAPTMVKRMTAFAQSTGQNGAGLRTIVYGGGPMYVADIVEAVEVFGPVFVQIYGQGECPMSITALSRADVTDRSHAAWRARLGSVGRAQSVVEVKIGDANGAALPPGQIGEIMVRGATVMPGYWRNAEATAKTIQDGWLRTGDMGVLNGEGYLTLHDRSKDMIISGGTNIYPREVEEALLTHPDLHEVSVVGQPDPEWGEIVVAFVVPRAGAVLDHAALDGHCLAQIARFKRPKAYIVLTELPKNNYGKVLKTALRERLAGEKLQVLA
ncbi:MAG: AMP-binding protein [Rhodobacterales bacterium]|nr:AMP-binding protein [Rhodobacterales bacterium]MDX5391886.1 AMP-binding protein [Rhodobacterales bacterium]MDX5491586.1 AMP-binding protein [Rhodobacterales bacterium]